MDNSNSKYERKYNSYKGNIEHYLKMSDDEKRNLKRQQKAENRK